jgi:hypothetical protein
MFKGILPPEAKPIALCRLIASMSSLAIGNTNIVRSCFSVRPVYYIIKGLTYKTH